MKKITLKLDDLNVDSFSTDAQPRGGVVSRDSEETNYRCTYAPGCESGPGLNCTLPCIEYSQATDYQICCG